MLSQWQVEGTWTPSFLWFPSTSVSSAWKLEFTFQDRNWSQNTVITGWDQWRTSIPSGGGWIARLKWKYYQRLTMVGKLWALSYVFVVDHHNSLHFCCFYPIPSARINLRHLPVCYGIYMVASCKLPCGGCNQKGITWYAQEQNGMEPEVGTIWIPSAHSSSCHSSSALHA